MGIEGPLSELNLIEVYQLIHMSRRSGVLQVESVGRKGCVSFVEGKLVAGELGAGEVKTLDDALVKAGMLDPSQAEKAAEEVLNLDMGLGIGCAVRRLGMAKSRDVLNVEIKHIEDVSFEMFAWTDGSFLFEEMKLAEDPEGPGTLGMLTENVIMEGSRRIDEWSMIRKYVPSLESVPKLHSAGNDAQGHIDLNPDEWRVLALIDGRRTVKEIATCARWDDFQTSKMLCGLTVTGIVSIEEKSSPLEGEAASSILVQASDFYNRKDYPQAADLLRSVVEEERENREAWILLGNCHFKASDYRSASQAYQKALALESKDKSVELTLGLCEIRQGRIEEARDRWKLALSWQPSAAIDDQLKEHLERVETWIELIRSHEP